MPFPNEPRVPPHRRFCGMVMEVTQDRDLRSYDTESTLYLRPSSIRAGGKVRQGDSVTVVVDEGYFFVRVLTAQGKLGWLYREFLKRKDLPL